jgi:hypothetical protein
MYTKFFQVYFRISTWPDVYTEDCGIRKRLKATNQYVCSCSIRSDCSNLLLRNDESLRGEIEL